MVQVASVELSNIIELYTSTIGLSIAMFNIYMRSNSNRNQQQTKCMDTAKENASMFLFQL